jgi:hypothetical protein
LCERSEPRSNPAIKQMFNGTAYLKCHRAEQSSAFLAGWRELPDMARVVKVHRSPRAVACRKRNAVDLGKPRWAPTYGTARLTYAVIEARMRTLGNGTRLESNILAQDHRTGRQVTAACPRGVLSSRVPSGGESPLQEKRPDGSTPLAKETWAGHVGLEHQVQHEASPATTVCAGK